MPTVGTLAKGVPFFSCSSVTSVMKSSRGLLCLALAGAVVSEAAGRGFFKGASRGAWEAAGRAGAPDTVRGFSTTTSGSGTGGVR